MLKWLFILFVSLGLNNEIYPQLQLGPVGSWRAHFSNESIYQVIKGDQLYLAAKNQIIQIDAKNQISYLNTTNGLHHIGIAKIAWHPVEKQLIIAYNNSQLDIVQGDQVTLIDDIGNTNLFVDKAINEITILNNNAYLSCNFGIVVIDLIKKEIKETLFPGNNRQAIKVIQTLAFQNKLFALTENGIWSRSIAQNGLWVKENSSNIEGIKNMFLWNDQLYFNTQKSIYPYQSNIASYQIIDGTIQKITIDGDKLYAGITYQNKGAVLQLNSNRINTVLIDSILLAAPVDLLVEGNNTWVADLEKGLYLKNVQANWVSLGGPLTKKNGAVAIGQNQVIIGYGDLKKGFSSYTEKGWTNYSKIKDLSLSPIQAVSIDPIDQSWWLGMGNQLVHFDPTSNQLETFIPSLSVGSIKSIQKDTDGGIAILKEGIGLLIKEGTQWNTYPIPANFSVSKLDKLYYRSDGLSWITSASGQGILLFQKKNNQVNWRQLNTSKGGGNLPSMQVTSITEDKEKTIWIGTNNGIALFQCNTIEESCDAFLPIVESNGFNGYLFQKETINSISVDGANRKWIGTNNGAWLISNDGMKVIQHFTTDNSPLPSNKVLTIGIEPNGGDVFFFTDNEIISYTGNATEGETNQQKIKIFPNPVDPNYNGPIIIRNLVENALVKITGLNGQLVYQTRALGGQASWNGRDQNQRKVASGIYLVFVRDTEGTEKAVGKIMMTAGY